MSNEVELISDDTLVPIRNIVNCETGYILSSSGRARRLIPGVTMRVSAGELRELFFQPGGSILLQNYINVGNKSLAAEFGVPYDAIEYNWTEADVNKCLLEDEIDVLLDALDFAPQGIVETLKDKAIELEINDRAKIKAIAEKTGVDIDAAIKNKHAYDNSDTNVADKPRQRRVQKTTEKTTTRKRRTTQTKKKTETEISAE